MRGACFRGFKPRVDEALEIFSRHGAILLQDAYYRDVFLQTLLVWNQWSALREGNEKEAEQIAKLRDFWNHADKGSLARTRVGREVLTLARRLHVYEVVLPAIPGKRRAKYEAELSRSLLNAAKQQGAEFELAFIEAKKFRAKRTPARMTEEGNLRADLSALGVLDQLFRARPPALQEVMEVFDPVRHALLSRALKNGDLRRAKNLERNFRKLLVETKVLPERKKRGRPRKGTY
jgi:hypothetical protein